MADIEKAKEIVCQGGKELVRMGLVAATWGNVSCRVDEHTMVITPSGIAYEHLMPGDMVVVRVDAAAEAETSERRTSFVTGKKPSSESPMHAAIYNNRPEVNAIIHFHSLYACTASVLGEDVPPYLEDMAQIIGPSIRISGHALTGSPELTKHVLAALEDRFGALLENHGAVCLGRDMEEAFAAGLITEKACQVHLLVKTAGGGKALSPEQAAGMRDFYLNRYQKK